ncbi:MAG: hypothetical protein AMXMBFR53_19870 [Gemmatimonadota bacterium]
MPAFRPYLTIVASIQYARRPQNCFIESFNATLRDECLNAHWFVGLRDAQEAIEAYPVDYNQIRPHSSRGGRTPEELAFRHPRELGGRRSRSQPRSQGVAG